MTGKLRLLPNPKELSDREKVTLSGIVKRLVSSDRDEFRAGRNAFLKMHPSARNIFFSHATEFSALLRKEAKILEDWASEYKPPRGFEDRPEPRPNLTRIERAAERVRAAKEADTMSEYDAKKKMAEHLGLDEETVEKIRSILIRSRTDPDLAEIVRKVFY